MAAIVIEGVDGTGKSTLAKLAVEKFGFEYRHLGVPEPGEDLFRTYLNHLIEARSKNIVFDRLHLGEVPYGNIMRGKSLITWDEVRVLNRVLWAGGGHLVVTKVPLGIALTNWRKRHGAEYVDTADRIRQIHEWYDNYLANEGPGSPMVAYDYTSMEGTKVLEFMTRYACNESLEPEVNGSTSPTYLFVGESPAGDYDVAFCSMKKSSGFLNQVLWDAEFQEREMAFVNAFDKDYCPRDLWFLWMDSGRPVVIALGNHAEKLLNDQGVPHLATNHPQFVKRFKAKARKQYVAQLSHWRVVPHDSNF